MPEFLLYCGIASLEHVYKYRITPFFERRFNTRISKKGKKNNYICQILSFLLFGHFATTILKLSPLILLFIIIEKQT